MFSQYKKTSLSTETVNQLAYNGEVPAEKAGSTPPVVQKIPAIKSMKLGNNGTELPDTY